MIESTIKDKNGKTIREDDTIRLWGDSGYVVSEHKVVWDKHRLVLKNFNCNSFNVIDDAFSEWLENQMEIVNR